LRLCGELLEPRLAAELLEVLVLPRQLGEAAVGSITCARCSSASSLRPRRLSQQARLKRAMPSPGFSATMPATIRAACSKSPARYASNFGPTSSPGEMRKASAGVAPTSTVVPSPWATALRVTPGRTKTRVPGPALISSPSTVKVA
jgi:hypothetical protein